MPGFDKTGPEGKGPMTGRGMGPCNPKTPQDPSRGRSHDYPRGRGRSFGRGVTKSAENK